MHEDCTKIFTTQTPISCNITVIRSYFGVHSQNLCHALQMVKMGNPSPPGPPSKMTGFQINCCFLAAVSPLRRPITEREVSHCRGGPINKI